MSGRTFYTIGIAFASGIFARSFFEIGEAEILLLLLFGGVLGVIWKRAGAGYTSPLFLMSLVFLFGALGVFRFDIGDRVPLELAHREGEDVAFEGVIVREPDERARTMHLYVRPYDYDAVILVSTEKNQLFTYGDVLVVEGTLLKPEPFETDLGRTFNYPDYLKARGVHFTIPFAEVTIKAGGEGNPVLGFLLRYKHMFMQSLEASVTEPAAGLGEGLLLGVKRAIGEDLEEAFRRAGIIHIVVLSGYNVMLVAEAIMRLLSFVFFPRTRLIIGIIGISAFALLVGLSATVVRASVMAILVLIARATGRTYAIMRALMFAGVVMILINPYLLAFDPGFQLSFLATLGLVFLAPLIEEKLHLVSTSFQIREFITATVATQVFVLPLLLYQMGEVSVVSLIVNVLALPMVPIAMLLTFATGVIATILPQLGIILGYVSFLSLQYIIKVAEFFAALPFATIRVPEFPFIFVILLYALLSLGVYRLMKKKDEYVEGVSLPSVTPTSEYATWVIVATDEKREKEDGPLPFR